MRAYDPVAIPDAKLELNGSCITVTPPTGQPKALKLWSWAPDGRSFALSTSGRLKHLLSRPLIVDTKNILDSVRLRAMGFEYVGVGRG